MCKECTNIIGSVYIVYLLVITHYYYCIVYTQNAN